MRTKLVYNQVWIKRSYIFMDTTIEYSVYLFDDVTDSIVIVQIDDDVINTIDYEDININENSLFNVLDKVKGIQYANKQFKKNILKYSSFINGNIEEEIRHLIVIWSMI